MKANPITRIVFLSLLTLVLIGILLAGMDTGIPIFHFGSNSGTPIHGQATVSSADIHKIRIEWVSGSIHIESAQGDQQDITIQETGATQKHQGLWEVKDHTLTIHYSKANVTVGSVKIPDKDLTVTLPAGMELEVVHVNSVSADVTLKSLKTTTLEVESVSGTCEIACDATEALLSSVSGSIHYTGQVKQLDCETVSGSCDLRPLGKPETIDAESVSGDVTIVLAEDLGFTAQTDSVSGSTRSDFSTSSSGGTMAHLDGACQIQLETVSGNIYLRKAQ